MPEPLTKIERRIFDYLVEYLRRNTYQPSIREIGRRFDIRSTKTVSEYLQALADKGWIERDPSRSRGVRLIGLDLHPETVTAPLYGAIAPEGPPLPPEAVVEELTIDRRLAGASGTFLLRMRGNSMEAVGIHDGDLLMVDPVDPDELVDGQIIVGRLDGEPIVNRMYRRGPRIVLEPANANFPAMAVAADAELVVLGRVSGVFRRFGAPLLAAATSAAAEPSAG